MAARRLLAIACAVAALAASGTALASRVGSAAAGARFIAERQTETGAFFRPDASAYDTANAVVALVAGDATAAPVARALGVVERRGPAEAERKAGYAAAIVSALGAAGRDARRFDGVDYVEVLHSHHVETSGLYGSNLYEHGLSLLALASVGETPPDRAVDQVRAGQCPTGGWSHAVGCTGSADVDTTSIVLSALLAHGASSEDLAVSRARTWLRDARNDDGGFGAEPGKPTNANSTGLALSSIAALGEDPTMPAWGTPQGNPLTALEALQTPSGGFRYLTSDAEPNGYATVQAVPGMAGRPYPVRPQADRRTPPSPGTPDVSRPAGPSRTTVQAQPTPPPAGTPRRAAAESEVVGAGSSRAGVVVRSEDGAERRICVLFDDAELTGSELLRRTELDIDADSSDLGTRVCRISGTGCDTGDCFCSFPVFWGYWTNDGDDWTFSDLGAHARTVTDGSMDAWVWGTDGKPAPTIDGIENVCPAAAVEQARSEDTVPAHTPIAPRTEPAAATGVLAAAIALVVLVGLGTALALRRRASGGGP